MLSMFLYCGASYWFQERNKRLSKKYHRVYTGCCLCGRVSLPLYLDWPSPLVELMRFDGGPESVSPEYALDSRM
jgi:hypothetical protein